MHSRTKKVIFDRLFEPFQVPARVAVEAISNLFGVIFWDQRRVILGSIRAILGSPGKGGKVYNHCSANWGFGPPTHFYAEHPSRPPRICHPPPLSTGLVLSFEDPLLLNKPFSRALKRNWQLCTKRNERRKPATIALQIEKKPIGNGKGGNKGEGKNIKGEKQQNACGKNNLERKTHAFLSCGPCHHTKHAALFRQTRRRCARLRRGKVHNDLRQCASSVVLARGGCRKNAFSLPPRLKRDSPRNERARKDWLGTRSGNVVNLRRSDACVCRWWAHPQRHIGLKYEARSTPQAGTTPLRTSSSRGGS